jgi:hypothetical protein
MIKNYPKVNHSQGMPSNPEKETSRSKLLQILEKLIKVRNGLRQKKDGVQNKIKLRTNLNETFDIRNQDTLIKSW